MGVIFLLLKLLFKDVLRHIKRTKLRSVVIIIVLALGVGMSTIIDNLDASLQATLEEYYTRYNMPDIVLWGNNTYLDENITQEIMDNIDLSLIHI